MKAKILWIEGKRADSPSFIPDLQKKGYEFETVPSGKAALASLDEFDPDLVILNAASMGTSGKRICKTLRENTDGLPVLLISSPDYPTSRDAVADMILELPFTWRKLSNRITRLLPADQGKFLHVGHIRLNLELRRVHCMGKEERLTPRLADLLHLFMLHPGEVLERNDIFRKVWKTEYTDDTRTLDVHVSWLRQAIEEHPRKPRFLKTIRGIGYRLDV
jgi:DNA-binding response OmpR family regulator